MLLLAVIVLCFSSPNEAMDAAAALTIRRRILALASCWALIFGLIVPLELLAFGWLVLDSSDQLKAQLSRASDQLGVLSTRLERTSSETELQRLLSTSSPSLLTALSSALYINIKPSLKSLSA
jgi:hypothetical protein